MPVTENAIGRRALGRGALVPNPVALRPSLDRLHCGIVTDMTEWPAAVDRRYHDAVIFDLDGLVTETVSGGVRAFDSTVPVLRRLRVYRGQRLHLRISGRTAALTAEAGGRGAD